MKAADTLTPEDWKDLFAPIPAVISVYRYPRKAGPRANPLVLAVWAQDGTGEGALDELQPKVFAAVEAFLPYPVDIVIMNRSHPVLTTLVLERGERVYGEDFGHLRPSPVFNRWTAELDEKE